MTILIMDCSQMMSAKLGGGLEPPTPFVSDFQHLGDPPFISVWKNILPFLWPLK